jgi:hypothetical protein
VPGAHVVAPTYRYGANAFVRGVDLLAKAVAGSEDRVHTLYPGRLDSDVLYLAAKIRAAKAKGTLDRLRISPHLLARQQEFEREQIKAQEYLSNFFERIVSQLKGQRVMILSTWNMIYDLAKSGLERGLRNVFSPDSVISSGGGAKGMVRPDNWEQPVCEFTGVSHLINSYGMSETLGAHFMCEHNHFHLAPWIITFVLDPDTSKPLPRTGMVTGRAAFFDLLANSHWGGFISGDEITVNWDGGCACGASSAYAKNDIGRYSERRGGDDKISCAATPEAHAEALEFLTKIEAN